MNLMTAIVEYDDEATGITLGDLRRWIAKQDHACDDCYIVIDLGVLGSLAPVRAIADSNDPIILEV